MNGTPKHVAIVTGGSRGIGAGVVTGYRQRGWAVVANAVTINGSGDADVLTIEGDITERATAVQIIGRAIDRFGRLESAPYITGEVLHIDGGRTAGHLRPGLCLKPSWLAGGVACGVRRSHLACRPQRCGARARTMSWRSSGRSAWRIHSYVSRSLAAVW